MDEVPVPAQAVWYEDPGALRVDIFNNMYVSPQ